MPSPLSLCFGRHRYWAASKFVFIILVLVSASNFVFIFVLVPRCNSCLSFAVPLSASNFVFVFVVLLHVALLAYRSLFLFLHRT